MPPSVYVIPTPLGGPPCEALPAPALALIRDLRDFVAENAKSARAFLAAVGMPCALQVLSIEVLDEHTPAQAVRGLLAPLRQGRALGLLSEAGCPAVADPGALLVAAAQREGYRVSPLIGPSSILLALMASGLEGQRFAFCGYLPRDREGRDKRIRELERRSKADGATQIFIETPYRNEVIVDALLRVCAPSTRLCVATRLTLPQQSVATRSIEDWRAAPPEPGRHPSVFLLFAG